MLSKTFEICKMYYIIFCHFCINRSPRSKCQTWTIKSWSSHSSFYTCSRWTRVAPSGKPTIALIRSIQITCSFTSARRVNLTLFPSGKGRWVRSSSCTTSGSTSRCRTGGSGCRWGYGAYTASQAGGTAERRQGRGRSCVPTSCLTWPTWPRRWSSTLWTPWTSCSSQSSHDVWLPTFLADFFCFLLFVFRNQNCRLFFVYT